VELQFIISICEVELHMVQVCQEVKAVGSESMAVGDTVCLRQDAYFMSI